MKWIASTQGLKRWDFKGPSFRQRFLKRYSQTQHVRTGDEMIGALCWAGQVTLYPDHGKKPPGRRYEPGFSRIRDVARLELIGTIALVSELRVQGAVTQHRKRWFLSWRPKRKAHGPVQPLTPAPWLSPSLLWPTAPKAPMPSYSFPFQDCPWVFFFFFKSLLFLF